MFCDLSIVQIILHIFRLLSTSDKIVYTVKPAHVVTSIKQSPVLKAHLCLVLS